MVEGADHDQVADGTRADWASAQPVEEVVEGPVGPAPAPFFDDRFASVLAEVADVVEADAHCVVIVSGQQLRQASNVRAVDVDREHFHPVTLQVLDQHARVIKTHRLVVQQPASELDGVIELQPGGLIGRACEGGGV